jgi:hypothetical protein
MLFFMSKTGGKASYLVLKMKQQFLPRFYSVGLLETSQEDNKLFNFVIYLFKIING